MLTFWRFLVDLSITQMGIVTDLNLVKHVTVIDRVINKMGTTIKKTRWEHDSYD
jgi:hypothetical protein